jgi:hypothetical protein
VDCVIQRSDGETERGRFSLIQCASDDPDLYPYFLTVVSSFVASLGDSPAPLQVSRAVTRLAELFHALTLPPRKATRGLWAELLVIAQASDPALAVEAWRSAPDERCDFSHGCQRLEVKSAAARLRAHHFSLEQLTTPADTCLLVASLLVEPAGHGPSIADMAERVRPRLASQPELLLRLDTVIAQTLGRDWTTGRDDRFDEQLARSSLAYYEASDIPSVDPELPAGVSEVHFRADLSSAPVADTAPYREMGGLFGAVLGGMSREARPRG